MFSATARTGIAICPETAACVGALETLSADGWIGPNERVVIFNTGALQKYPEAMACDVPTIDPGGTVDYACLL